MSENILDSNERGSASKVAEVKKKIVQSAKGNDEPVGKTSPHVPPAIVFATYPILLAFGAGLLLVVMWWFSS